MKAQALWWEAAGRAALREEAVRPGPGDAVVRTLWSGVSRGTERLVGEGRVPQSEQGRMRAPNQAGDFPFPVKYGYCAVGRVEDGPPELIGRDVFSLHPHQTLFAAPAASLVALPEGLPARRAVLAANMETALNAAWDARVGPGDRVAVMGAGAVGLLVAALCARIPGVEATVWDVLAQRGDIAAQLGVKFDEPPAACDVAFNASASAAGLARALESLGPEGTLVEMSWHGAGETPLPLGGAFHSQRLRIVSSQVGSLPPARRPRWSHRRRLETALRLLLDDRLDVLIDEEIAFEDAPAALPAALARGGLATVIRYD
ncbi:zinc-dependent alcohol dehydrogenase [Rubrimonas cliftonensis]|uniref:Threonine dehydrogenase n=1 Tax=Rubrimonas cliftonensis TaxID=89524 RepID=A0A1H4AFG6_9RHOB|nr:zinc-binding alcohol dehydrogenase [Rubrimonas cliftonensis]SEA34759.1 Threonine dehydrogenase [Rubrimonas cliftonensis]